MQQNSAKASRTGKHPTVRDPVRTRTKLLRSAFGEIHRSGFRGADVDTILRSAGVTKGALYHHFENKEALGHEIIDQVIADIMRQRWQVPLEKAENPIDAIIAIVEATPLDDYRIACGCPLNNISHEMSQLDEGFRSRAEAVFRQWHAAIAAALLAGQAGGSVAKDVDPGETAFFIIAAYEGYLSLAKNFQNAQGLKAGIKTITRYLNTLRAPSRAPRRRRYGNEQGTQPDVGETSYQPVGM